MKTIAFFKEEYFFLSNFFCLTTPVVYNGLEFFTTEAAYVAAKTSDVLIQKQIQKMKPGEAKRFGREIFLKELSPNPNWSDTYRLELMHDLVHQKFTEVSLKQKLLDTTGRALVEGNTWHDNFFGICVCGNCPKEKLRPQEEKNNLGRILMKIREIV